MPEPEIEDTTIDTRPPDMSVIAPKPGWTTSQGQMTALFSLIAIVLSFLGINKSTEEIQSIYEMIMRLVEVIGPLVAIVPVLISYINSRGKTYSNAINASAAVNLGGLGSILKSIGGGDNWKDPKRYGKILEIVNSTGVIPGPAGKIVEGVLGGDDSEDEIQQLIEVAQNHEVRIRTLEQK